MLESHAREKPAPTYKKPVMPVRSSYVFCMGWALIVVTPSETERVPLVCILVYYVEKGGYVLCGCSPKQLFFSVEHW